MAEFGHFGSLGRSHMSGNGTPDALIQVWWLAWAAYAPPHGYNVLLASFLNYPAGQNFGVQGSMLALGVVLSPITKVFGPVVAWNIAVRLAFAASATSMCLVLRRWTSWWPAAFLGGFLYGFSAYMTWNAGGAVYLFLLFVPLPPVIFLVLHEVLVRQQWRPGRTGALLAVLCTVQFFISTEVLAGTVVIGVIAVVLFVIVNRRAMAERWRYALTAIAYALAVGCLLLLVPMVVTFAGPQHVNGSPFAPWLLALFPGDLLSSVLPNGEWLGPKLAASAGPSLGYGGQLYLGLPLVVAVASFAVFLRKRRAILFAGTMALVAFVLSLGSHLWVDGRVTPITLPFVVFPRLPAFQGLLAARLSVFTALFVAGMFAIGVEELWRRLTRPGRFASMSPTRSRASAALSVAALGVVVALPLVPDHTAPMSQTSPPRVPSFFTSAAVDAIPARSVVLAYPYPDSQSNGIASIYFPAESVILDQAIAGMRFKLIGGYGWFPSPTGPFGTVSPALLEPQSVQGLFDVAFNRGTAEQRALLSQSNLTLDLRLFLHKYHVTTVLIVNPVGDSAMVADAVTAAIGPPVESGGVTAWFHVKHRLASKSP